jgi:hypothetical protein
MLNHNFVKNFSFEDLSSDPVWNCNSCFTDLKRLKAGKVGAQVTKIPQILTQTGIAVFVLLSVISFHLRNH